MPIDVIVPLSGGQKLSWFFAAHWRGVLFVLTPCLFSAIFVFADDPIPKHFICGYTLLVMATFWVTEVIPLAATSIIPIFMFPMAGILSTSETCFAYMADTVIMIIASLLLAYSFEASGLHNRMALGLIQIVGYTHARLLFGLSFMTMFISICVANMAATTMMLPIITAVLEILEKQGLGNVFYLEDGEKLPSLTSQCYYLVAAYSSSIGGIGSLVGTGTNLAFKGLFETTYPAAPELLSFTVYSGFTLPVMFLLNTACYFYMRVYYMGMFRPNSARSKEIVLSPEGQAATKANVKEQWNNLGRITYYELVAGLLFLFAMVLFVTRSPSVFRGWADEVTDMMVPKTESNTAKYIRDSVAGLFISTLMFLLPSSLVIFDYFKSKTRNELPSGTIPGLLVWQTCEKRIPWEFLLLVGGGFALSTGSKASGLSTKIGEFLTVLQPLPPNLILFMVHACAVFVTNFCANVAIANILVPVAMELAKSVGVNPLLLCLAAGLGSSFCFCLPIGTPCNAIVQATCHIKTGDMVKCGAGLSVVIIVIMYVYMSTCTNLFWDVDTVPEWAN